MVEKEENKKPEAKKAEVNEVKEIKKAVRRRDPGSIGKKEGKISALKRYAKEGFAHRVFNDDDIRIMQKTEQDDWDVVKDPKTGEVVKTVVGKNTDGSPQYGILCRKPQHWFDEDKAKAQAIIDQDEKELLRGTHKSAHADLEDGKVYVPNQDGKAENRIETKTTRRN